MSVPVNLVSQVAGKEKLNACRRSVAGNGSREIKDQNVSGKEFGGRQSMKLY